MTDDQPGLIYLHPDQLEPSEWNANEMKDKEWNALVESIQDDGWTVPLTVVPIDSQTPDGIVTHRIIGGEHRWQAAKFLEMEAIPCFPVSQEKFDEDRQKWHSVRQNIVHGGLNPEKFAKLYEDMATRYSAEVVQSLMGFTSEEAFRKVYAETARALPPEMRKRMEDQKDELKSIDDLSRVLNQLFREYGETLPSNFMVFSHGGKDVLWVQADRVLWKLVDDLARETHSRGGDFAEVMTTLVRQGAPDIRKRWEAMDSMPDGPDDPMVADGVTDDDNSPANDDAAAAAV